MKYLDNQSIEILREVLRKKISVISNLRGRNFATNENSQSPEIYIAKLLNTTIPMSVVNLDNAEATIYQIVNSQLVEVENLTKVSFNLSIEYVFTSYFFPVIRDKFGKWIITIS